MNIIYLMLPLALCLGGGFLVAFLRAGKDGQYDDLDTPAYRMLLEDSVTDSQLNQTKPKETS